MRVLLVSLVASVVPCTAAGQARAWMTNDRLVLGTPADLTASLTFVDVDGDGDLDVVTANGRHWAQLNEVHLNNGSGRFTVSYPLGSEKATSYAAPAGDLDGDGDVDVVVGNDQAENWVYLNDGRGRFSVAWPVSPEIELTRGAQLYAVYVNDGTGLGWTVQWLGEEREVTYGLAAGDLNGDSFPDLGFANSGALNRVYLNHILGGEWSTRAPGP